MADIICIECKTTVSDASGFCPECGYPFDTAIPETRDISVSGAIPDDIAVLEQVAAQVAITTEPTDIFREALDSIKAEIGELQKTVIDIKQSFDSNATVSAGNTQKTLSAMALKLDEILLFNSKKEAEALAVAEKDTKKGLFAAFYKTLNSPNSMFEYMFYITIVQIIFVIVNLFLVAYIVTLVR